MQHWSKKVPTKRRTFNAQERQFHAVQNRLNLPNQQRCDGHNVCPALDCGRLGSFWYPEY